jgi:hypothetical protein
MCSNDGFKVLQMPSIPGDLYRYWVAASATQATGQHVSPDLARLAWEHGRVFPTTAYAELMEA